LEEDLFEEGVDCGSLGKRGEDFAGLFGDVEV
jgi:hypothetical protein